jgi:hypothetical protein
MNKFRLVALLFVLVSLSAVLTPASAESPTSVVIVTAALQKLEPYVHAFEQDGISLQELEAEAALMNGFSEEVVFLAQEMVNYQNELALTVNIGEISDISQTEVLLDNYPRLKSFFDLATAQSKETVSPNSEAEPLSSPHPCGNYAYPVPNYTPPWGGASSPNPRHALLSQGFNHTQSYACGGGNCSEWDFTRGRDYWGPYGYCSYPRFRDHGIIQSSTAYGIQLGEPNPEIFHYSWPYWNWGTYVLWWHNNF